MLTNPAYAGFVLYTARMDGLVFGLFGLIVGSFLNVLILRHGKASLGGRSACPSCKAQIRWGDNIPVLSWLILRGRCRDCRARISLQYPLVEVLTGALFFTLGTSALPLGLRILSCAIAALLIAIAVYDLYHTIIPDSWVWAFNILALLTLTFNFQFSIFNILAGPLVALPLFAVWLYSRGEWMGFGDVKLALGMGWLLGAVYGFVAMLSAFVMGAVVGVLLIALTHIRSSSQRSRGFTMKSEIPFGPFLVAGTFIVWLMLIHNVDPLSIVAPLRL